MSENVQKGDILLKILFVRRNKLKENPEIWDIPKKEFTPLGH